MIPGVNGNALTGEVPQTRSQAGIVTPADATNAPPAVAPAKPYGVCQDCIKNKMVMDRDAATITKLQADLDQARTDVHEMSVKLEAASGVTLHGRQAETIVRLQKTEAALRASIYNLEMENGIMMQACREAKVSYEEAIALAYDKLERRA